MGEMVSIALLSVGDAVDGILTTLSCDRGGEHMRKAHGRIRAYGDG